MAIAAIQGFVCRSNLTFHRPLVRCVYKRTNSVSAPESTVEPLKEAARQQLITSRANDNGDCEAPQWKKLNSKDLGIRTSKITKPTRFVLNVLRKNGYDVYLVGGCVRDLILKRTPKDFDIITSAELKEVLRTFPRCEIVGKRFPICHVHVDETIIEVSSFSTSGKTFGRRSNYGFRKPAGCSEPDFIRWRNCLRRDFTINGLMFDPFAKIVYDYTGGMEDIQKAKVRSVIPAGTSFVEDCARILRGVRIAARLGFRLSRETSHFVKELSYSLLRLDRGRILMELNYMLAYGSAEASLRLLWKFGLLEILLPIQAAYFVSQGFRRRDKRYNMLLALFCSLDKLVAPDRPCHCCLWVGMLAFHKALVDKPRDPLVVAAFCIAIHNGGCLSSAVDVAASISQPHDTTFSSELLLSSESESESQPQPQPLSLSLKKNKKEALSLMKEEVIDLAASVEVALNKMTDEDFVSRALEKYPQAPRSDMVFISWSLGMKVWSIFECVRRKGKGRGSLASSSSSRRRGREIDYEGLGVGRVSEVRHLFARLVFDTLYPTKLTNTSSSSSSSTLISNN